MTMTMPTQVTARLDDDYSPELGGPTACSTPAPGPCTALPRGPGLPLGGPGWWGPGPPTGREPGEGPPVREDGREGRSSSLS